VVEELPAGGAGGACAGAVDGVEDVTAGADAVVVAIGAEGVATGVSGMSGVVGPVAVSEPVPTATGGTMVEAGGAATFDADADGAGGAVGAGAMTEGGGTDGTLPPMAPRPNWAF